MLSENVYRDHRAEMPRSGFLSHYADLRDTGFSFQAWMLHLPLPSQEMVTTQKSYRSKILHPLTHMNPNVFLNLTKQIYHH